MKSELTPPTNHVSTSAPSPKRSRKSGFSCALVLAMMVYGLSPSAQSQTLTVLHSLSCFADGAFPVASVIRDSAGNLYGTALYGGDYNCDHEVGCGTVFKVANNGKTTGLHEFTGGTDGSYPAAGLIQDAAGNLYGSTASNVFKLDSTGSLTVLHTFKGPADGSEPTGSLVRDTQGNLYGTTALGGDLTCGSGCGTVYKLDKTGKETILYRFTGGTDGLYPSAGVIRDAAGNLVGTTRAGGAFGGGTVFKVDDTGNETVLHSFAGGADGTHPFAGLIPDAAGNLYGTTELGGASGRGTVFKLDNAGNETVLYSFTGGADGGAPVAGLVPDQAGNLYGTTQYGGFANNGTVFELDTTGKETVLHRFTYNRDGAQPQGGVVRDGAGNLYGTTQYGGASGCGTVFEIKP